jgi:NitT/TauT family transport system substrate-binding protein
MRYLLGWSRTKLASGLLATTVIFMGACSSGEVGSSGNSSSSGSNSGKVIRIAIGTQDQVINTAVGGATVRELELLEKHLPTDGKYEGVRYDIQWSSYTSGPPITNKMLANQLDIGLMGDFPAVINLIKFQQEAKDANSVFVGTLAYSPTGAGNAVVVPKDSTATSLADLKGGTISVPFGSAAHGMVLNALADAGLDPETDVDLISQAPEVGGASLRTGQIDAHADFVPFGELFPFRGFARKIFDGAQTGVPTLHGITVRSDFAEEHPEIVVAYLKAVLEANQMFREDPEGISTQIEGWSGVDKEVVYMFLGPSGLQPLDPTIGDVQISALKNSIATLTNLGRLENPVDPEEVTNWIDESYLLQAMEEMGLAYDEVIATAEAYQITGEDALTGEAITDPKRLLSFGPREKRRSEALPPLPTWSKLWANCRPRGRPLT